MVDNVNPNSQFHPYQPVHDTPAAERQKSSDALSKVREYALLRTRPTFHCEWNA
jgi:hypothetical protein